MVKKRKIEDSQGNITHKAKPQTEKLVIAPPGLSWDCLGIIIGFLPLNEPHPKTGQKLYKSLRMADRSFYRLICQRRKSLILQDN